MCVCTVRKVLWCACSFAWLQSDVDKSPVLAQASPVVLCAFVWLKAEALFPSAWHAKMAHGSMRMAAPHTHIRIART